MKKILWLAALAAPLLLSACSGGSDDSSPPPTSQLPSNINESAQTFIAYIKALIAETDAGRTDDKEPLDVTNVNPATPENEEPEPAS